MNKNKNLKPIKLLKTKKFPSLFSDLDNNIKSNKKKINIIPLTYLFKEKEENESIKVKSFIGISNNKKNKNKNNSFMKYKSLSQELLPIKYTKIKLPRIKQSKGIQTELKESMIESIINKFNQCDNKFKIKPKYSNDFNLNKYIKYNYNFNKANIPPKYDYKKIYSKLFKRIKKIKSLSL